MEKYNVLFVDDELNILNAISRITVYENFFTLIATSGEKALEAFKENEIAVIVTDMKMPKMNGLELLEKVKEVAPNTVRIVLSGYAQISQVIATVNKVGVFKYITKPWKNDEEFLPAIHQALEYYDLIKQNSIFKRELEQKNDEYIKILDNNNKLIKNFQTDVNSIKNVTKKVFSLKCKILEYYKNSIISLDAFDSFSNGINEVYFKYLNTLPSVHKNFDIDNLKEKIVQLSEEKIKIVVQNKLENLKLYGNESILLVIIESILKVFISSTKWENIIINFTGTNRLYIDFLIINKIDAKAVFNSINFKLAFNVLDDICNFFGGKLLVDNTRFIIKFNTSIEIQE